MILSVMTWIFVGLAGSMFVYLAFLSLAALGVKWKKRLRNGSLRAFAIVVPAHNEQRGILRTLQSLEAVAYPVDKRDIIVIADNCTDNTAAVASQRNAIVMERFDEGRRGKGYALEWGFHRLLESSAGYDAFVVIDADSVVSENLLLVLNDYLDEGRLVLQVTDVPEARPGVWSSEVVRIGMTLYNVVRPLGRRLLGWTAGLRGNGMCFSAEVLKKFPWRAYSLTEDLEYGLQLLMGGLVVTFVPEASVYATMPSHLSATQRERWETGRFSVVRRYVRSLLGAFLHSGSPKLLDALADLLFPPFVNAFAASCLLAIGTAILFAAGAVESPEVLVGWAVVLACGSAHVFLGLFAARADKHLFRALAYVPRYALWKLSLYTSLLLYGIRKEWIRTIRE